MITPAKKKNLYEEISSQLIEMIDKREWKPGDKIPGEMELSRTFEVSRNSVRESIKALELIGILSSKTGKGTFVTEQAPININNLNLSNLIENDTTLLELMETRLIIEPNLVYKAVLNATEADIAELEEILSKGRTALQEGTYTFAMGLIFHRKLISMAGNKILENLLDSIRENLIAARRALFSKHLNIYIINEELNEHEEMLKLIKARKASEAQAEMYRHIDNAAGILRKNMKS